MSDEKLKKLPMFDFSGILIGRSWYWRGDYPLVRIRLDYNLFEFSIWGDRQPYRFAPGDIQNLRLFTITGLPLIVKPIQITHNRKDYSPFIVFHSYYNVVFWKDMFNQAGFNLPPDF